MVIDRSAFALGFLLGVGAGIAGWVRLVRAWRGRV